MSPTLPLLLAGSFAAAPVFRHGWGSVSEMMAMHGQGVNVSDMTSIEFAATHYKQITTAAPCSKTGHTIEDLTLTVARAIKAANPDVLMGMYWRTDFLGEILTCSNFTAELKATGNATYLRDDHGNFVLEHGHNYMWDYSNKEGVSLFARALVNVVNQTLSNGKPILDYIYLDGPKWGQQRNISKARNAQLQADKNAFFADLQRQFAALPSGPRGIILNSVDTIETAQMFNPTGAGGMMVDHFSILQFLVTGEPTNVDKCNVKPPYVCGQFNVTRMRGLFDLVRSKALSNITVQIKGWVGPIISQRDLWPTQMHTPTDGAEKRAAMAERFNSELAFFLLLAEDNMWWEYSWFWGFDSFVPAGPHNPDGNVPENFFPQAKCPLGAPAGPYVEGENDTFMRSFESAEVFVDLHNRTNSRVTFKNCPHV